MNQASEVEHFLGRPFVHLFIPSRRLGGKLFELIILVSEPLRQRSRIVSHCMRRDPRLIFATARENSPSDAASLLASAGAEVAPLTAPLPIAATTALEMIEPTPGTVITR